MKLNFTQSKVDYCLCFKDDVICSIYVDNTIFQLLDDNKIDQIISELKLLDFESTDEGVVDLFLCIIIDTAKDGTVNMTQNALTQTIIETLCLENDSKQHLTPAVSPPLQKYEDSKPFR